MMFGFQNIQTASLIPTKGRIPFAWHCKAACWPRAQFPAFFQADFTPQTRASTFHRLCLSVLTIVFAVCRGAWHVASSSRNHRQWNCVRLYLFVRFTFVEHGFGYVPYYQQTVYTFCPMPYADCPLPQYHMSFSTQELLGLWPILIVWTWTSVDPGLDR